MCWTDKFTTLKHEPWHRGDPRHPLHPIHKVAAAPSPPPDTPKPYSFDPEDVAPPDASSITAIRPGSTSLSDLSRSRYEDLYKDVEILLEDITMIHLLLQQFDSHSFRNIDMDYYSVKRSRKRRADIVGNLGPKHAKRIIVLSIISYHELYSQVFEEIEKLAANNTALIRRIRWFYSEARAMRHKCAHTFRAPGWGGFTSDEVWKTLTSHIPGVFREYNMLLACMDYTLERTDILLNERALKSALAKEAKLAEEKQRELEKRLEEQRKKEEEIEEMRRLKQERKRLKEEERRRANPTFPEDEESQRSPEEEQP